MFYNLYQHTKYDSQFTSICCENKDSDIGYINLIIDKISLQGLNDGFLYACQVNNMKVILHLLEKYSEHLYSINKGFVIACNHNHLNLAKFFLDNYNIDIHYDRDCALENAKLNNNTDIIDLLQNQMLAPSSHPNN